jgi:small conductance mechanosensitive channel
MNEEQVMDLVNQAGDILTEYAISVAGAVIIIIVGWIIANWLRRAVLRALNRSRYVDETLKPFIASIVRYTVLIFVIIAVLAQFGVQTTSIIAVLGAAGLAIGLALQGTLSNIAAGVMLLMLRPFKVGDYIDADGIAGTVNSVGLFVSELCTFDGVYVSVPNASLWNRTIKNYSRLPTRRVDVAVGVSYGDDVNEAMRVLKSVMESDNRVLPDPAHQVMVTALADSAVNINMRCWVNASDYWDMLFDLHRAAKVKLDDAGISIPFPQRDVHIIGEAGQSNEPPKPQMV